MDIIYLKNLKVKTRIGIFDWEKQVDQIINVNIELGVDIKKASETDDIKHALNYKNISKKVINYIENNRFNLIEKLAEKLAEMILSETNVLSVELTISKPGAIRGSEDVGITITRKK
ncbi:MAG: dihydroneopterin aldolase [Gammaproteobacteria bacterium]|nr:dihydroneopterin aldolase [Gammaproteobacteria bacterium]|tara:strand:- start:6334 stop:6684 length:351 start_codon:yes stop_codon:yes gene_type:complete